jgi:all-trans-retinol 13,14-reductase
MTPTIQKQSLPTNWDAIVIGSGMGGLTFASLYAQMAHKRVLILERHYVAGGFTHAFERKGFSWDVGLHYVGAMAPGSPSRALMDFVTGGEVSWEALPDCYDVYHYPDLTVKAASDPEQYERSLIAHFPAEAHAIRRYFADVQSTAKAMGPQVWSWSLPKWISTPMRWLNPRATELSTITVAAYMQSNFVDKRLIAALCSHWGDYGLPPDRASFATHAMITASYFGGAYFPVGGSSTIAHAAIKMVKAHGGDCLTSHSVDRILIEDGKAVGVKVGAVEYRAPLIVSNAGRGTTLGLFPGAATATSQEPGATAITLYLGLKESPNRIGVRGENHWIHKSFDHAIATEINSAFLSFSSMNNPAAHKHTAQVMAIVDPSLFQPWKDTQWKRRGASYEELKSDLAERLLSLAEQATPGLRELVAYQELSTPLTVEHFTGSQSIYGAPGTPARFKERALTVRTPIPNLLLTGADACCLGIQGAMMGGVFAAGFALHPLLGFPRIMKAAQRLPHNA